MAGLYQYIPDNLFSILASAKRDLYADALFVVREAFKTELTIRKSDLLAMLIDKLESEIIAADFAEELLDESVADITGLSGKAHILLRRLIETGWIEIEYASNSFEENITVPDYAIKIINLLYDLTNEAMKEYNSYVFATYSALKNAREGHQDYLYQAMTTAYRNTVELVDELKTLFNNIKKYQQRISDNSEINELLKEHFTEYKTTVIDRVYHPLKTMDSVPRFKNHILLLAREYAENPAITSQIIQQGQKRGIYTDEENGHEDIIEKVNFIVDTYESIGELIDDVDHKHAEYTRASVDKMRYLLNADHSVKGKLVELLKRSNQSVVSERLIDGVAVFQQIFMDSNSLYNKVQRRDKSLAAALSVKRESVDISNDEAIQQFIAAVKNQYSDKRIDQFIDSLFGEQASFSSENVAFTGIEAFILFILGTIRANSDTVAYCVEFSTGYITSNGYKLPKVKFYRRNVRR